MERAIKRINIPLNSDLHRRMKTVAANLPAKIGKPRYPMLIVVPLTTDRAANVVGSFADSISKNSRRNRRYSKGFRCSSRSNPV